MADCAKYTEWTVDYVADELGEEQRRELEQHASSCADCRKSLEESQRVVALYRGLPDEEPGPSTEAGIWREAFVSEVPQLPVAPPPRRSMARWLALAASVLIVAGAGIVTVSLYLDSEAKREQLEAEQAAETARLKQEAEEAYAAAAAAAANAAKKAEEASAEAKRLKGTEEEKEALARAEKLAKEAEKAKKKAGAAKAAGGKATGKAGGKKKAGGTGKKKAGMADDPLGADFEL